MAFPDRPQVALGSAAERNRPAYLVKFPQDVWERIIAAGSSGVRISHADARLSLELGQDSINLEPNPLGAATEIYRLADKLEPLGQANTRLAIPFSAPGSATSRTTDKPRIPAEGKRANGVPARMAPQESAPLSRSHSTPVSSGSSKTLPGAPTGGAPVIPLKTRVVQLLALGAASVEEIVGRVGGAEGDVMRVVKVVGRQVAENPPRYSLQPSQYTKVKIAGWRYTHDEQVRVGEMAREAFDELELSADAEERSELERKLEEAASGPSQPATEPVAPAVPAAAEPPHPSTTGTTTEAVVSSANGSPQAATKAAKPRASAATATATKGKGVVAREMAKFKAAQARSSSASRLHETSRASPAPVAVSAPHAESSSKSVKAEKADRANTPAPADPPVSAKAKVQQVRKPSAETQQNGGKAEKGEKRKRARHPSPTFTSSEDEDEAPSRGRSKRPVKANPIRAETSTSTSRARARGDSAGPGNGSAGVPQAAPSKRKAPPQPLDLSRHSAPAPIAPPIPVPVQASTPSTTASDRPDDPEDLRDRYEELYPAYQQMTLKLIALHRAAEGLELGDGGLDAIPAKTDLEKMVKKWEKWHNELTGIRRWFGSVA